MADDDKALLEWIAEPRQLGMETLEDFVGGRPRGEEVRPYDAPAIIDAVAAVSRMVLRSGGRLASGGHPTITPVMLTVGEQVGVRGAVDVFQSRWFEDCISEETTELAKSGVGFVHFVDKEETMEESLAAMRREILKTCPAAAVFVGGMDGTRTSRPESRPCFIRDNTRSWPRSSCRNWNGDVLVDDDPLRKPRGGLRTLWYRATQRPWSAPCCGLAG